MWVKSPDGADGVYRDLEKTTQFVIRARAITLRMRRPRASKSCSMAAPIDDRLAAAAVDPLKFRDGGAIPTG